MLLADVRSKKNKQNIKEHSEAFNIKHYKKSLFI